MRGVDTVSRISLADRLHQNQLRRQLVEHPFFQLVKTAPATPEQVAIFIGQWWHPLHYFPTFLARCVAVMPSIEAKTAVTKILSQETGEGDPRRAHEVIYIDSMKAAGFSRAQVAESPAFAETAALVTGYERASGGLYGAMGFVFATEVADLAMVSGIGTAVQRVSGVKDIEWVKIHLQQEPDHVEQAEHAVLSSFRPDEEDLVMDRAEEMWRLWIGFFDRLESEVFATASPSRAARPNGRLAQSATGG